MPRSDELKPKVDNSSSLKRVFDYAIHLPMLYSFIMVNAKQGRSSWR